MTVLCRVSSGSQRAAGSDNTGYDMSNRSAPHVMEGTNDKYHSRDPSCIQIGHHDIARQERLEAECQGEGELDCISVSNTLRGQGWSGDNEVGSNGWVRGSGTGERREGVDIGCTERRDMTYSR